ncbi:hypothetical protein [Providencia sp.]|uniref:hypothetical protein n=1 Tax=Providencia sp. TaxID=589 RepID=UPI003F953C4B
MTMRKTIKVNKLLLDINNPRFPDSADNQRDAISKMLEIQSDKIIKLAKDIASKGLDPSENILVHESEDEAGFYIVDEGNRRVTALKLLLSPELTSNEKIRKIFEKIQPTLNTIIDSVENCIVFEDDSYAHWVNMKHTGQNNGVGRVEWTSPEKARHMARNGKLSFGHQLFENIQYNYDAKNIDEFKKHVRITNISRLFDDPDVRRSMNIQVNDGYLYCYQAHSRFLEQLSKILDAMTEKDDKGKTLFTVNRIRSKTDRTHFIIEIGVSASTSLLSKPWKIIDGINKDDSNKVEENNADLPEPEKPSPTSFSPKPMTDGSDVISDTDGLSDNPMNVDSTSDIEDLKFTRPPTSNRNYVIPANIRLNFKSHKKCSRIFTELKKNLRFDEATISISIMLRIFIDLSVTVFAEENNLSDEFKKTHKGREPGLHDKVVICTEFLHKNKKLLGYESKAIMAASSQITKSAGSLQQYVHNPSFLPTKEAVNTEWDNFQRLLEEIWK